MFEHLNELDEFPKSIRVWTVNEEEEMKCCFINHLTGLHTDYPAKALQIREMIQNKG